MPEVVRFSPSPTGALHLGGARTALFDHLVARRTGGRFILRIEDTDVERAVEGAEARILDDLRWLGLRWDEGPDVGGPSGPYRQSERTALYRDAVERLGVSGGVYRCFCTPDVLGAERAADARDRRAPRYGGRCRAIDPSEAEARARAGERFAWRFAVPSSGPVEIDDAVYGRVVFEAGDIGDFLLMRSDGRVLYDLACSVDDAAMGVTLVLRGADHLSNTPRQVLLHRALGKTVPRFAHVPLVVEDGGAPMSKTAGGVSIGAIRAEGFLPDSVVAYLATLGWSMPGGREPEGMAELVETFALERVSRSPAMHDPARLRGMNAARMRSLDPDERSRIVAPFIPALPDGADPTATAAMLGGEVEVAGDAAAVATAVVDAPAADDAAVEAIGSAPGRAAAVLARALLSEAGCFDPAAVAVALRDACKADGLPLREALPAVRAALTGRTHGLPIAAVLALLGATEARARLGHAIDSTARP